MSTNPTIEFYNNLLKLPIIDAEKQEDELKRQFFNDNLQNNALYKYISFNNDDELNRKKLDCLKDNLLWFSAYHTLSYNDPTEFQIKVDLDEASHRTGYSKEDLNFLLETLREPDDLCCFSSRMHEHMWNSYANNHSGICCIFSIVKTDMLMPVIYCKKEAVDFTNIVIQGLNTKNIVPINFLAKIAYVLKDEAKYGIEQEIRLLCGDICDNKNGPIKNQIYAGKKQLLKYYGTTYSYDYCGVKLEKIIIGKNTSQYFIDEIKKINIPIAVED